MNGTTRWVAASRFAILIFLLAVPAHVNANEKEQLQLIVSVSGKGVDGVLTETLVLFHEEGHIRWELLVRGHHIRGRTPLQRKTFTAFVNQLKCEITSKENEKAVDSVGTSFTFSFISKGELKWAGNFHLNDVPGKLASSHSMREIFLEIWQSNAIIRSGNMHRYLLSSVPDSERAVGFDTSTQERVLRKPSAKK